jgi:hypothetical protein
MSKQITIIGPNLPHTATPFGQAFIAHAAGCRDIALTVRRFNADDPWTVDADTHEDVALAIYECHIEEESMTIEDAVNDIHFCPCCGLS